MFEEFELQYQKPLMTRCGLSYYGCCEPLDAFLTRLTAIPNMRKLGVSPWSDVNACAEIIGGKYVAAVKPNPAFVSGRCDTESVKKETETIAKACIRYGCPYEMVLKDISTVSYKPDNLIKWADTVKRVLDVYY